MGVERSSTATGTMKEITPSLVFVQPSRIYPELWGYKKREVCTYFPSSSSSSPGAVSTPLHSIHASSDSIILLVPS